MASLINAEARSSSSSLPLSSTDHQNHYTYEVFLSFRGEDTRFNFTDHLYTALCQRGIETFRDDKLRRGEDISQELLKAIDESRVSIIVFSQNYAVSRWCLDELVKILDCRKSKGQEVRAVFYKVDPSDVRHQTGAFGDAFATLDQCKYKDSMGKWKAALKEAADLSGWPFKDGEYEGKFINDIVGELSARVVNPSCVLQVAAHPIGLESCRQHVNRLLHSEENIVRMVGIWGPGGIGKTTIAKDVFNSMRHKFDHRCFLADVRSNSNGLAQLQETLLFDILKDSTLKVRNVDEGVSLIKERMQQKKILLILDDVSHSNQLQNLAPSDCFGRGSRILITTRDKRLLTAHQIDEVYEVKMLGYVPALKLFSLNAFKRNGPPADYLTLAQRAVRYAQGLPLALIVLGSHLFRRSREEWEATLDSCRGEDPHREIRDVLKISYDALGVDLKGYFLDIACFFKGKPVVDVKPILEACYDLKSVNGIAQLREKALIRIDGGRIWMHDLIEEMGKDIVYQQSPDEPGERSRVWREDDVDHVLTNNTGTYKVTGIQVLWGSSAISFNAKSFSKMKNLRYISLGKDLIYEFFSGDINYLSNQLRWLDWPGNPLQSFPSNFVANKLVKLNISDSCGITQLWEGRKNFPILTSMDLRGCKSLIDLPNFTGIPNLIELKLDGCESLVEVHQSVGSLHKLVTLSVRRCYNLVKLPSLISLKSLLDLDLTLDLSDFTRLEEFPKIIGKMDSLRKLILSHTSVKELHPSIGNLIGLRELYVDGCEGLTTVPCSIYELQSLEFLSVSGCSKLDTFPSKASISHDHDSGSPALPKLRKLRIKGCNLSTANFIWSLDCLETLTELDLSSNNFVTVPALGKFVNLSRIGLYCCKRLQEIPELPPNILKVNAGDCESLERFLIFPKSLNMLQMNLWNCHRFSYNLGNDMEKMESILRNNQNNSRFSLVLPGSGIPKWFHCSKEVTANEKGSSSKREISFEIPSKLNWEYIGVALCSVSCFSVDETFNFFIEDRADIFINGVLIDHCSKSRSLTPDHMWLAYIPLSDKIKGKVDQNGRCQVRFYCAGMKSYGVHLVCQPPNEYSNKIVMATEPADESGMLDWLSLSCANPEQKRPRTEATDDYDHQQEQHEQPIGMIPSKRLCTEEQPSMAPNPIIHDYSDYSASATTSDIHRRGQNKRGLVKEPPKIMTMDEQEEQPIPSNRHCTEEQPSMPPILDYSAFASTSDQNF